MSRPRLRLLQEGVKTENDHINLKVAGQDGSVVQFKIKRHTPLSKLMKAYCERQVRCGRGRLRVRARGCAPVNVCTFACTRVHGCVHTCVRMCARVSLHMRVRPSVALLSCPRLQVVPTACPSRLTVHPSPGRGARWPPGWGRAGRLLPWRSQRLNLCAAPPPPHGGWATSVGTRPWSQCGFQTVPDPVPRFLSRHWPPTP